MKSLLVSLVVLAVSCVASAETIVAAYGCTLASAQASDPTWKSQAFPLIQTSDGYEAASTPASSIFELTAVDASKLPGFPTYAGGQYYVGGSDVFVLIPKPPNMQVIKPLETDPNTQTKPAYYNCVKTM